MMYSLPSRPRIHTHTHTHTYTHTCTHTHHSLITDDDGSYLPRPDWAKATGASALPLYGDTSDLHVDSALSDLEEEALYITRNSLEDFIPIGEGGCGALYTEDCSKLFTE